MMVSSQNLNLSFTVPNRSTSYVDVKVETNDDPKKYGFDLLFPTYAISDFLDYPVIHAAIRSPISRGYASMYGWIQVVRMCESSDDIKQKAWEIDLPPATLDVKNPFCWFGPEPKLFDAPAQVGVQKLDWTARTFLTYVDDCLMTKNVRPILAFEWGFWIEDGKKIIKRLRQLGPEAWNGQLGLLNEEFPSWTFHSEHKCAVELRDRDL